MEIMRTLQDKCVSLNIDIHMECLITHLMAEEGKICGCFGIWRQNGRFVIFKVKAVILATGGIGQIWKVTSNSHDCTADGFALAYLSGAELIDMEFVQFHPTGMVWPPGVKGLLVTEAVRAEGGILKNRLGERFMQNYDPERMELSTRDLISRAIYNEVKEGRDSEHGGVYLDISHKKAEYIKRKLPSMYEQFLELADIDITKQPMEVGPTCHYAMGGVKVEAETQASTIPGLFAAGEVAAGLHGGNRLGGNSLSDLLVFGKRAGIGAAEYAGKSLASPEVDGERVRKYEQELLSFFESKSQESPYVLHQELQEIMQSKVGIIRNGDDLCRALEKLEGLNERYRCIAVAGARLFNSGWHLAITLKFMLHTAEVITRACLERRESRGSHTREDYPNPDEEWERKNVMVKYKDGESQIGTSALEPIPEGLRQLLEKRIK